jgi:L-malate glycosyltransferase
MKVLFVSHSSGLYGAERSLLTLVDGLVQSGRFSATVLLPSEGPLTGELRKSNVPVIVLPFKRWINHRNPFAPFYHAWTNLIAFFKLKSKIQKLEPDLIYSNSITNPFGALLALGLRVPHIWHAREFVYEDINAQFDWGTTLSMAFVRRTSTKVICNSKAVQDKWKRLLKKDIFEVVYNGINLPLSEGGEHPLLIWSSPTVGGLRNRSKRTRPTPREEKIGTGSCDYKLLVVGSIHPGKGIEDAIQALARLIKKGHAAELHIAGYAEDKRYFHKLKSSCKEIGVDEQVKWLGFVSQSESLYEKAFALLICSRSEAFGRVAVEAMAHGVPVVGTRSGGLPEIILHDKTGLLYSPGDSKVLAAMIERLILDQELYQSVTRAARDSIKEKFSVARYISNIQTLVEDAVASGMHLTLNTVK